MQHTGEKQVKANVKFGSVSTSNASFFTYHPTNSNFFFFTWNVTLTTTYAGSRVVSQASAEPQSVISINSMQYWCVDRPGKRHWPRAETHWPPGSQHLVRKEKKRKKKKVRNEERGQQMSHVSVTGSQLSLLTQGSKSHPEHSVHCSDSPNFD